MRCLPACLPNHLRPAVKLAVGRERQQQQQQAITNEVFTIPIRRTYVPVPSSQWVAICIARFPFPVDSAVRAAIAHDSVALLTSEQTGKVGPIVRGPTNAFWFFGLGTGKKIDSTLTTMPCYAHAMPCHTHTNEHTPASPWHGAGRWAGAGEKCLPSYSMYVHSNYA